MKSNLKNLLLCLLVIGATSPAFSEEVGVKVDKISTEKDTTISITKGNQNIKKRYHVSEGEEELSGDTNVVRMQAMDSWKKACVDWKKEFKDLNKENQIISMNCGKMSCSKEGVETTCTSKASYKVKLITEE